MEQSTQNNTNSQSIVSPILVQQQSWLSKHKILLIAVIVVVFAIITFIIIGNTSSIFNEKTNLNDYYAKSAKGIYYFECIKGVFSDDCVYDLITEADKNTFTIVSATTNFHPEYDYDISGTNKPSNSPYAKDVNHVYLDGKVVPGADPKTFVYLGDTHSYDVNWYYEQKDRPSSRAGAGYMETERYLIQTTKNSGENVKPIIDDKLQIFPDKVIFNGQPVPELDAKTLKKLNSYYYQDKNYLVWVGNLTNEALLVKKDPQSNFQVIDQYGQALKDNTRVVYNGKILGGANPAKFVIIQTPSGFIGNDGQSVYSGGKLMPGIDASTFTPIPCTFHGYFKDKNHVYYHYPPFLTILMGIDPNTFKFNPESHIADKNGVYHYVGGGPGGKQPELIDSDSSTFQEYKCTNE